jgi:hypothetical protein
MAFPLVERFSGNVGISTAQIMGATSLSVALAPAYTSISNTDNTPTTKKGIIPHKKIKERKAHNNCLRKTSNNNR